MKRCCKNVDITNREFLSRAVRECLKRKIGRKDTLRMFEEYTGTPYSILRRIARDRRYDLLEGQIETVIDGIRSEILSGDIHFKPILYMKKKENEKLRTIGIQNVKQQIYDYIAVYGLEELFRRKLYRHQYSSIPGRGPLSGMQRIRKWVRNKNYRYAWKGDAKHYYENISVPILKKMLKHDVKNERLLKLVFILLESFKHGLSIGSYLSQYLANYYMAAACRYAANMREKKTRRGLVSMIRLVDRVLVFMDDILFLAKNLKRLKVAVSAFKEWAKENLDIKIKESDKAIDLRTGYIDMLGYLISREKVICRPRIFRRFRRSIARIRRAGCITLGAARRVVSRYGWMKSADTKRWMKKSKAEKIVKLCKEMISDGKNVLYQEPAGCAGC